jgi:hypothetical protein
MRFHQALRAIDFQSCSNCNEGWYDMEVDDSGLCSRYREYKKFAEKYSAENFMDPGPRVQELARQAGLAVPESCIQLEAMLLSPVFNSQ